MKGKGKGLDLGAEPPLKKQFLSPPLPWLYIAVKIKGAEENMVFRLYIL